MRGEHTRNAAFSLATYETFATKISYVTFIRIATLTVLSVGGVREGGRGSGPQHLKRLSLCVTNVAVAETGLVL